MVISYIDTLIILFYLLAILFIGFRFAMRQRSPEMFMVAKRSLPGWLIGFSLFATYVSNITLVGTTAKAYAGNWSIFAKSLALPVGILVATVFFIPFHVRNKHVSAYTHLEGRFGTWAMLYGAFFSACFELVRMGVVMYLVAIALKPFLPINEHILILITGSVVVVYTYVGGLEAVVWTDLWQGIVLLGGAILSIIYIFLKMPDGPAQVFSVAMEYDKMNLGSFAFSLKQESFWVLFVLGLSIYLKGLAVDQTKVQRYIACKSVSQIRKGLWINFGLFYLFFAFMTLLLGACLFAFYKVYGPTLNYEIPKSDMVFPYFIANELPMGVKGLLIAAILAAAMSSIDSSLNSISTVFYSNFYKRFINKQADDNSYRTMKVIHRISLICGVLAIGIGMSMIYVKSIWDTWYTFATAIGGAIFGLFLLGILSKRVSSKVGFVSALIGVLSLAWMQFSPKMSFLPAYLKYPFHGFLTGTFVALVIVCVGLFLSLFFPKKL